MEIMYTVHFKLHVAAVWFNLDPLILTLSSYLLYIPQASHFQLACMAWFLVDSSPFPSRLRCSLPLACFPTKPPATPARGRRNLRAPGRKLHSDRALRLLFSPSSYPLNACHVGYLAMFYFKLVPILFCIFFFRNKLHAYHSPALCFFTARNVWLHCSRKYPCCCSCAPQNRTSRFKTPQILLSYNNSWDPAVYSEEAVRRHQQAFCGLKCHQWCHQMAPVSGDQTASEGVL